MTGPSPRDQTDESRALTGLRGIGALLVVIHHLYVHANLDIQLPGVEQAMRQGYLGVDLFFVLSGFVLSMVYGPWFDDRPGAGLRRAPAFMVRRIARIWPLHAVMLIVAVAVGLGDQATPSLRQFIANLVLIQGWGLSAAINPPAWSISTEMLAYLLFPLLAWPLLRGRFGIGLGLATVAVALTLCLTFAPPLGPARRGLLDLYRNYSLLPLLRCLAGVVLGMVTWRLGQNPAVQRSFSGPWAGPAAMGTMLMLLVVPGSDLVIYALLPAIVLGLHFGRGPGWRLIGSGPIHALGVISYAIYLTHFFLLWHIPIEDPATWSVAYFAATLATAIIAHRLIDRPARAALRQVGDTVLDRLIPGRQNVRPLQNGWR